MSSNDVDLARHPIHLHRPENNQVQAQVLTDFNYDGPSFEHYVDTLCSEADPGRLVMMETSPADWTTWERHRAGDEVVVVLQGEGVFIQQIEQQEQHIPVGPGSTLINPAGVWHTANVSQPITAVYITPCRDTDHKAR